MAFNEATLDRVLRIVIGLSFGYVAWGAWPGRAALMTGIGAASLLYLIVGLEVFTTGVIGWSPLYALFGWSTKANVGA
jgi:DUF2892 family protein